MRHTVCGGAGLATAVVSNFDTRLRPLLGLLGLEPLFDEIIVRRAHAWQCSLFASIWEGRWCQAVVILNNRAVPL